MSARLADLEQWLETTCALSGCRLEPVAGDASFRRYFRVEVDGRPSLIAMDAPPDHERPAAFVELARRLAAIGVHVPAVHAYDLAAGFVLLEDLGDTLYLDVLDAANADRLYGDALATLVAMQRDASTDGLPVYNRDFLLREMSLFREWLLTRHAGIQADAATIRALTTAYAYLADSALAQPYTFVHRDYHSRNLMPVAPPTPGVLDFQDAVVGPISYDAVSLLKDCYIAWPDDAVARWMRDYVERAADAGLLSRDQAAEFPRWFELMGAQRHLKAAGIFARLKHRDGRDGYLSDIPRTLRYLLPVCAAHAPLKPLTPLIERLLEVLSPVPGGAS